MRQRTPLKEHEELIVAFIKKPDSTRFMSLHRYMQNNLDDIDLVLSALNYVENPASEKAKKIILYQGFIQTTTKYAQIHKEQFIINEICNSGTPTGTNSDIYWFLLGQLLSKSSHANELVLPQSWGTKKRPSECYNYALWKNPSLFIALEELSNIRTTFVNKITNFDRKIKAADFIENTKNDFDTLKDATHTAYELHEIIQNIPSKNRQAFLTCLFDISKNINKFHRTELSIDQNFVSKIFKTRQDLEFVLNNVNAKGQQTILKRLENNMPLFWLNNLPNVPHTVPPSAFFTTAVKRRNKVIQEITTPMDIDNPDENPDEFVPALSDSEMNNIQPPCPSTFFNPQAEDEKNIPTAKKRHRDNDKDPNPRQHKKSG